MKVIGAGLVVVSPSGFLYTRKHHSGLGTLRLLLRPDVPFAVVRLRISPGLLEPGMLVGGVVHDEVDEDANTALLGAMGEIDEIAKRAVARVDAIVIGHVITIIAMRRRLKRHQPNGGNA